MPDTPEAPLNPKLEYKKNFPPLQKAVWEFVFAADAETGITVHDIFESLTLPHKEGLLRTAYMNYIARVLNVMSRESFLKTINKEAITIKEKVFYRTHQSFDHKKLSGGYLNLRDISTLRQLMEENAQLKATNEKLVAEIKVLKSKLKAVGKKVKG
jgi:hypothetical protein